MATAATDGKKTPKYVDLELQPLDDESDASTEAKASLISQIARENLKTVTSLDLSVREDRSTKFADDYNKGGVILILRNILKATLHPMPEQKKRLAFMLLRSYESTLSENDEEKISLGSNTKVMDPTTWQDLELLCGTHQTTYFLAGRIDHCATEIGRCLLYRKIATPTDDIQELENQREIIRELVENKKLFEQLNDALKDLELPENCILSCFDPNDEFNRSIQDNRVKFPFESKSNFIRNLCVFLNKSTKYQNFRNTIQKRLFACLGCALMAYALIELPNYMITSGDFFPSMGSGNMLSFIPPISLLGIASLAARELLPNNSARVITSCLAELNYLSMFYESISNWRIGVVAEECIRTKLHYIAIYFSTVDKIVTIMEHFPLFTDKLPEIKAFCRRWKILKETSKDFSIFLKNLNKPLFLNAKGPWFSHWGEVFSTYFQLINLPKECLIEPILAISLLDVQLSIAKFFKKVNDKHKAVLCFPTYLHSTSSQAAFDAQDFWSPMIDEETVVPTSLKTGTDKDHSRDVLITGPNAGGKSTITRAIIQAILMAQTLGIACATSLTFTPFSKIMSYLNITDDCAKGNSYFMACAKRARELYETVKVLPPNKYALLAIDELFNGTDPEEASIASVRFLRILGSMANCTLVANTHFKAVTALEQEYPDRFKNHKVKVEVLPDGKGFKFPYILFPGISDQIITLQMVAYEMAKAGCPVDFLVK